MSMGAYDEDEHERREKKTSEVNLSDDTRTVYEGKVEYDAGESAEELLDQFQQIKSD
ncbi:MAG: DUF5786 family protein [Halobacteriaceae archaeon]